MIRYMSADALTNLSINSKKIAETLRQDLHFQRILPDEFTTQTRVYVLNILNTLTAGEFEQFVNEVQIAIQASRD